MARSYYEIRDMLYTLGVILQAEGFSVDGLRHDQSDVMSDYFSPGYWGGTATISTGKGVVTVSTNHGGAFAAPKGSSFAIYVDGVLLKGCKLASTKGLDVSGSVRDAIVARKAVDAIENAVGVKFGKTRGENGQVWVDGEFLRLFTSDDETAENPVLKPFDGKGHAGLTLKDGDASVGSFIVVACSRWIFPHLANFTNRGDEVVMEPCEGGFHIRPLPFEITKERVRKFREAQDRAEVVALTPVGLMFPQGDDAVDASDAAMSFAN